MTATAAMVSALKRDTPKERIKHRPAGKDGPATIPYVDARYVMDTLDEVVGPESWQDAYVDLGDGVRCGIGINIEGEWVWKWDVGTPSNWQPLKGAYSDALKRAGVRWGIARDLYEDDEDQHSTPSRAPAGRTPSSTSRPAAPPTNTAAGHEHWGDDMPYEFGDEPTPIKGKADNSKCPEHGVTWNGEWGDLWHKTEEGGYCRHPDNTRQPGATKRDRYQHTKTGARR